MKTIFFRLIAIASLVTVFGTLVYESAFERKILTSGQSNPSPSIGAVIPHAIKGRNFYITEFQNQLLFLIPYVRDGALILLLAVLFISRPRK